MAAAGTVKSWFRSTNQYDGGFPLKNPRNRQGKVAVWVRSTQRSKLQGYTLAEMTANSPYTFTLDSSVKARLAGKVICGVWMVSPEAIAEDAANYNTIQVKVGANEIATKTTRYGILAWEPWEIPLSAIEATRTLALADVITLVVTKAGNGGLIPDNLEVWLVLAGGSPFS